MTLNRDKSVLEAREKYKGAIWIICGSHQDLTQEWMDLILSNISNRVLRFLREWLRRIDFANVSLLIYFINITQKNL